MPITVNHVLTATTPDDPSYEIRPSHWNSAHVAVMSATAGTEIYGAFSNDPAYNVTFTTNGGGQVVASANVTAAPSPVNITGANGSSVNAQTLAFSNSNGITLGVSTAANGATVTGSYTAPSTAGLLSAVNVSAGTTSNNLSALTFSNANGVTFGLNASTVTASVASQTVQTQNMVSVLGSTGNISFANGNGITFGGNASTITASHNGLTTARASNDAVGLNTAQSNVTWTVNSSGLSLDARGYAGTATAVTGGAAVTLNSGGLSFNGGSLAGTSSGFTGANISASITHNTAGLALSMSVAAPGGGANFSAGVSTGGNTAGDTGVTGTRVVFAGGNNITVSQGTDANGATITISGANAGGAQTGISGIVVSNTTYTSGTVSFSNANGISFGSSAGQAITASYTVPSTAGLISAIGVTGSNGNFTTTGLSFSNANGMSFGTSAGSAITASYTVPTVTNSAWTVSDNATSGTVARLAFTNLNGVTLSLSSGTGGSHTIVGSHNALTSQSNQAASGSNGSFTFQTLSFSNANGISFGTSAGPAITASYTVPTQSAQTLGLYASSQTTGQSSSSTVDARSFSIVGAGGISVGLSAGSFIVSQTGGGGVNPAASASNGSFNFTTLNFSNANNVTFGTSAGGIITASVAAPGAAAENNWVNLLGANTAGNTTASGSTIGYSGINLTLSGTNGSVVNISAPATSSLVGTNGVSISTAGSTISIYATPLSLSYFNPQDAYVQVAGQQGQGSLHIQPMQAPNVVYDRVMMPIINTNSSNSSGSHTLSFWVGIYTRNASTLSLASSTSATTAVTHSGTAGSYSQYSGVRLFSIGSTNTITEGQYWVGILSRTTSGGANGTYSQVLASQMNSSYFGLFGAATNATQQYTRGLGVYSATTSAMPGSIAFSQINGNSSVFLRQPIFYLVSGTV